MFYLSAQGEPMLIFDLMYVQIRTDINYCEISHMTVLEVCLPLKITVCTQHKQLLSSTLYNWIGAVITVHSQ